MKLLKPANERAIYKNNITYKESIFNVSTGIKNHRRIVFNTYSGAVVLLREDEDIGIKSKELLAINGIYVPVGENETKKVIDSISFNDERKINHFTILPTTACNADCFYCYEGSYKKQTLSNKDVNNTVKYIVSQIADQPEFVLDWYGGEPLLCSCVIDNIINGIKNIIDIDRYRWESVITTNATLFTDELIIHAIRNWNLSVAHITVDGNEEEHNKRKNLRSDTNAFKEMYRAIKMLLKNNVYVNLRIHLDKLNITMFNAIMDEIKELIQYKNLHLFITPLFPPSSCKDKRYYYGSEKEELFEIVYGVLKDIGYCSNLLDELPKRKKNICSAFNKNEIIIGADGSFHKCIQELETEYNGNFYNKFENCVECMTCAFFPICLGGCSHNRKEDGREPCVRNRYIVQPILNSILDDTCKKYL